MFINAELSQLPVSDGRKAERRIVNLAAALREEGATTVPAIVLNLSESGFKVDAGAQLQPEAEIWLKLPGSEAKRSRVVWVDGNEAGCEFETPFHPAELQAILAPKPPKRLPQNVFKRA